MGTCPETSSCSRHRFRWLGHAARMPESSIEASMVKQLLFAYTIPGHPRPVGRPHYTRMDGAMQDLSISTLGPWLQLDLLRD